MKSIKLQKALLNSGLNIFSSQELRRASGMTKNVARLWLIRHIKNGTVLPLKKRRGIYCFAEDLPHDLVIANKLYSPSYVSLETALSYYGILPETVYSITSITTRTTRRFELIGKEFSYQKIKTNAYFGYKSMDVDGRTVLFAEKEKALADYLYFVFLRKKSLNERIRIDKTDKKVLMQYLKKYQVQGFINWGKNVITKSH